MPCFDIKDTLFLTNCWDLVEADAYDSDTSDEEDEVTKVWRKVKKVILDKWAELPEENIFRVSLKQKRLGVKNWYTEEYERFERKLNQIIATNLNKKIQFYYQFITNLHEMAVTKTFVRCQIFERPVGKIIEENQEKIVMLENKCKKRRRLIDWKREKVFKELSLNLRQYLQSEQGRQEILNLSDEREIGSRSLVINGSELMRRIQEGITRWFRQGETKRTIQRSDGMIRDLIYIQTQMKNIETGFVGINALFVVGFSVESMYETFISLVESPSIDLTYTFRGLHCVDVPYRDVRPHSYSKFDRIYNKKKAIEIYDTITSELTKHYTMKKFEKNIAKFVKDVLCDNMPKNIDGFKSISKKFEDKYKEIKDKRESVMNRYDFIGCQIKTFKESCLNTKQILRSGQQLLLKTPFQLKRKQYSY